MVGTLVGGKYRLGRKLGEGGMGAVYEAVHGATGRRVAVKVISSAKSSPEEALARFERETRAAGACDSQHIAQVLDAGVDEASGWPFMVMEYLAGEDLRSLTERLGPLAPDVALRVATQTALGLQKAHEAGFVHRDIKPANLFLARRDEGERVVKVLDFGIAKVKADPLASRDDDGITRTGSLLGSPRYMSPEQARGSKSLDHRTDVWALGIVLYEMLSGVTPHEEAETLGELIIMICSSAPGSVQERAPWVAPEIAAIVERCLALRPEDRFESMAAFVRDAKALLPGGWSIDDSMLAPMAADSKRLVAARHRSARADAPSSPRAPSPDTTLTSTRPPSPDELPHAAASTGEPRARVTTSARSRARLVTTAAIGAVAVAVAVGAATLGQRPSVQSEAPPAETLPAGPTSAAPSTTAPGAPPPEERAVSVVLTPAKMQVWVDGVPADVADGVLAIRGPLGSTHTIRSADGREKVVVVGAGGAEPSALDFRASVAKAPPRSTAARPATTEKRQPAVAPKPEGSTIGFAKDTSEFN